MEKLKFKLNYQYLCALLYIQLIYMPCSSNGQEENLPSFPKFAPISEEGHGDSIHFEAAGGDSIASSSSNVNNNLNTLNNDLVSSDPRFDARISQLLATNALQLAHDIGETILSDSTEKTEVFSPLSIYGAINLLLLGANGQTFDEIMKFLKFNEDDYLNKNPWKIHEELGLLLEDIIRDFPNPKHQRQSTGWKSMRGVNTITGGSFSPTGNNNETEHKITIANGLFVQNGFSIRPDYKNAITDVYQSKMKNLDFLNDGYKSAKYINEWVNKQTHGKITEMISDSVHPDTKVILVSALYFKAMWERTFFDGATSLREFFPDGEQKPSIKVDMMAHGGIFPFYNAKEYDCRILGFPYKKNLTTMYVILPNNSNKSKLRDLQSLLSADKIENMISKMEWKTAVILFPKMHISNKINLKSIFQKLGAHRLFDKRASDLSLMSTGFELPSSPGELSAVLDAENRFSGAAVNGNLNVDTPLSSTTLPRYPGAVDDDDDDKPLIFSRDDDDQAKRRRKRRNVSYKVPSSIRRNDEPLRLKDFIISKRITKGRGTLGKKNIRAKRNIEEESITLKNLDRLRNDLQQTGNYANPGLYAEDILHKIDLTINEKGTEGGAATFTLLYKSGTDVIFRVDTPFMFLIRHDDTKLPLFYGTVYEPTNDQ